TRQIYNGSVEDAEKADAMSGRKFGSENLDAGDVNRDQNSSQHEHAQSKGHGDESSQVDVQARRGVDETTGQLRAKNRDDAQQREAKELKETSKINSKCFDQNVSTWRF